MSNEGRQAGNFNVNNWTTREVCKSDFSPAKTKAKLFPGSHLYYGDKMICLLWDQVGSGAWSRLVGPLNVQKSGPEEVCLPTTSGMEAGRPLHLEKKCLSKCEYFSTWVTCRMLDLPTKLPALPSSANGGRKE